jgi:hypothetical protein
VRRRIARRKESSEGLIDGSLFGLTNFFLGAEPILERRTGPIAPQPIEFMGSPADSFLA